MEFCSDIERIDRKHVKKWLKKIPDANGVIVGGGSPCQGLSKLSVDRRHLEDPRSKLFHNAVAVMKMVKEESKLAGMWCIRFLENVVPDEVDIQEMSIALEMRPRLVDSKHLSRARRPRTVWRTDQLRLWMLVYFHCENHPLVGVHTFEPIPVCGPARFLCAKIFLYSVHGE